MLGSLIHPLECARTNFHRPRWFRSCFMVSLILPKSRSEMPTTDPWKIRHERYSVKDREREEIPGSLHDMNVPLENHLLNEHLASSASLPYICSIPSFGARVIERMLLDPWSRPCRYSRYGCGNGKRKMYISWRPCDIMRRLWKGRSA